VWAKVHIRTKSSEQSYNEAVRLYMGRMNFRRTGRILKVLRQNVANWVSELFKEGYSYTDKAGSTKVDAFAWVNNDSMCSAGLTDEFAKTAENNILGKVKAP
jgi:hypothetical protein